MDLHDDEPGVLDGPTIDEDDDAQEPARPGLWRATVESDFGLGLAGLLIALLSTSTAGTAAGILTAGMWGNSVSLRTLSSVMPLLGGLVGVTLGVLALRFPGTGLGRSFGAAAAAVGLFAVLTSSIAWYSQESALRDCGNIFGQAANYDRCPATDQEVAP